MERGQGLSPAPLLGALHVRLLLYRLQESRDPYSAPVPGNMASALWAKNVQKKTVFFYFTFYT